MGGDHRLPRPRIETRRDEGGRRRDEAVEEHHCAACTHRNPHEKGELAPAEGGEHVHRLSGVVRRQSPLHDVDLARDALIVEAGAATADVHRLRGEQPGGERTRNGRVADPHLPQGDHACVKRRCMFDAALDKRLRLRELERRSDRDVARRPADADVDDVDRGSRLAGEHRDGRPAAGEVGEHLAGHLLRVGAHALRRDAVVGRCDHDHRLQRPRIELAGDPGDPDRQLLEPAEAAPRLRLRVERPPGRVLGHSSIARPATTKSARDDASTHTSFTRPRTSR